MPALVTFSIFTHTGNENISSSRFYHCEQDFRGDFTFKGSLSQSRQLYRLQDIYTYRYAFTIYRIIEWFVLDGTLKDH